MRHIKGFHAIRAVSVVLVILSHVGMMEAAQNFWLIRFFSVFNASFGVRAFFVLSGFLITTLLLEEVDTKGRVEIANFMKKRAFRILPLYLLLLFSLLPYFYYGRLWEPIATATYALFLIYNFIPNEINVHYLSHLWSLGVEEQFYVVWPFVVAGLAARRSALVVLCLVVVAICFGRITIGYGSELLTHYPNRWTIPAIYPIAIGAGLAVSLRHPRAGAALCRLFSSTSSVLAGAIMICLPLATDSAAPVIEMTGAAGTALLISWIYTNQHRRLVMALEARPIFYVGTISYGLYMWQGVLTGNGPYRQLTGFPPEPWLGALMTIPVAVVSYHAFEKPIAAFGRRWVRGETAIMKASATNWRAD